MSYKVTDVQIKGAWKSMGHVPAHQFLYGSMFLWTKLPVQHICMEDLCDIIIPVCDYTYQDVVKAMKTEIIKDINITYWDFYMKNSVNSTDPVDDGLKFLIKYEDIK